MKILLINPSVYNDLGRYKAESPPLSLLYLAGYLEKNGYLNTKVIDMDALKLRTREIGDTFLREKPDIVGVGGTAITMPAIVKTAKLAKEKLPDCLVVAGGYGPTNEPEKVLRTGVVDVVVLGEGEQTLLEIVKARENGENFENINGTAFLKNTDFVFTEKREPIRDLDSLPLPAFHLLTPEFSKYPGQPINENKMPEIKKPIITVLGSRGCPHHCSFCSLGSKVYRQRSPKNIVDQIELYKKEFGAKTVALYDDEFVGMSPQQNEWVKEICNEIIKRNLGLKFITQGRCSQFIELETLRKMKEAGFAWVWWGVESGSQRLLDEVIHKNITIENVHRTFTLAKEAGLKSLMFIMVGFPKETPDDIKLTFNLIKKIKPNIVAIKIATGYPGTALRKYLEDHNLLDNKLEKFSDYYRLETDRYVNHHTEEMTAEEIKKYYKALVFRFGPNDFWYYVKFALKSLITAEGWKKLFGRIKIIIGVNRIFNMFSQKKTHNSPSKIINFDGLKIELKEGLGDLYVLYLETNYCRIKKTLELLAPEPKNRVLEVGCDAGLFALICKKKFKDIADYQAVEVEPEKIRLARSKGISVASVNVEREKLPFDDNSFDLVLFTEVIEHLSNPLLALSEIKRVVKPIGTVIISTPNAVGLYARYNHLMGANPHHPPFLKVKNVRKGQYGVHRFEYSIDQLNELLEDNGYKVEKTAFSRYNHQRRGIITKIIERLSLSKPTRSDIMIFKCKVLK